MKRITVALTWGEVQMCAHVGTCRFISARTQGHKDRWPNTARASWDRDIRGCLSEFAFAKYTGRTWLPKIGEKGGTDVGPYQVRSMEETHHRLCIKPQDKDDEVFILVFVSPDDPCHPQLVGWATAGDVKLNGVSPDGFYYMRQDQLWPMEDLNGAKLESVLIFHCDELENADAAAA